MKVKKIDILKDNWKVLIILDACRYDSFKKYYKKFLKGQLKKNISCATWTLEWLEKTFTKKYNDIIYVSMFFSF